MTNHEILGGRVQLFQRPNSKFWQCSCSVGGQQCRTSTKEERLASAKSFAEDWFLGLLGAERTGDLVKKDAPREITFADVAEQFMLEYETITAVSYTHLDVYKRQETRLSPVVIQIYFQKIL